VLIWLVAAALLAIAGGAVWRLVVEPMRAMRANLAEERRRFEALAHEDPLTGLPNKRAFEERVEMELRRAEREYYQVAIVVLDLDRFKMINDSWGHAVGDDALQQLSTHIQAQLRAGDLCGRMGGDEFMLALVRADARSAERVLARLRESLRAVRVGPADDELTFTAGIAEFPSHATDLPELTRLADYALYWGKARGRNQWFIYSPETDETLSPLESAEAIRRRSLVQTLQALAKSIDAKNRFTGGHSERVATYAVALAESLGFEEGRRELLRQAALLHDVGKIGVAESVLVKEMPLNLEDESELERHSELGRAMLAGAGMPEAARWVYHLHERFDGRGYPDGLAGRQIPVESRILHAADALDKMTRPHSYRRHRPLREALAELAFGAGTRLDPELSQRLIQLVQGGKLKIPGHEAVGRPLRQPATRRMRGGMLR
jgi:diguanylate cyclase (GGDEF)-like protein/putative nucleotidyltransferase with HDIG domain